MERKVYINKLDRKLRTWDKDIARLEKKADKIAQTLRQRIDELKEKREQAASKTSNLLNSSEEAWIEMKNGAKLAMNDLKKACKKAKTKFR